MEFLLVGESKIKIVLNEEERKKYGLNSSSADVSGSAARRSFWQILDLAKNEVGFDPSGDKVLIQIYPIKEGCEIFVTKLGILPESSARLVSKSSKVTMLSKRKSLYAFNDVEDVIRTAKAIKAISGEAIPKADVFFMDERYYLSIEEYGKGGESLEFPCILEFGSGLTADVFTCVLEHAVCLTNADGIEKFSLL